MSSNPLYLHRHCGGSSKISQLGLPRSAVDIVPFCHTCPGSHSCCRHFPGQAPYSAFSSCSALRALSHFSAPAFCPLQLCPTQSSVSAVECRCSWPSGCGVCGQRCSLLKGKNNARASWDAMRLRKEAERPSATLPTASQDSFLHLFFPELHMAP